MELTPTKLAHYTLPTFGALALLAAVALTRPIGTLSRRLGAVLGLVAAGLIVAITVYGVSNFATSTAQTWAAVTMVTAVAAAAIGGFLLLNKAPVAGLIAALALGIVSHAALSGTIRQLRPLAIAPQLTKVLEQANLHPRQGLTTSPVAITTFHEPSFVFLTGRATQLTDAEGAARALAEGRPAIVEARDAEAFAQAAARLGVTGRAVGEVSGHNYSTRYDVNLTVYAPPGREVSPGPAR